MPLPTCRRTTVRSSFAFLPREKAADTFEYLEFDIQQELLKALGKEEVAGILNEMSPDDRTAFLQELPGPLVRQLMELLSPNERSVARNLLGYPPDSVGRLMTPEYIAIRENWTVGQVLEYFRAHAKEAELLDMSLSWTNGAGSLMISGPRHSWWLPWTPGSRS